MTMKSKLIGKVSFFLFLYQIIGNIFFASFHKTRSNRTKGHIVKTLAAVIKMLWSGECKYISSKFLKSVIGEQDHVFGGMDQQDSHEFLVMLIDWLQSDLQSISMV